MEIKVTERAVKRIAAIMAKNSKNALRISVQGGGCSGFMYQYNLIDAPEGDDHVLEQDSVKIAIDDVSYSFLQGCTIDFVEELGNSYFKIINPQATAKCGCGNSFAI